MRRVMFFLMIAMVIVLASCGGGEDSNTIRANAIVDDDFLEVNLNVSNYATAGDHATFFSKKDLNELKDVFDAATITGATLATEIVNDSFLMIDKTTDDGKTYPYMVANVGKSDDKQSNYYYFSAPKSILDDDDHTVYIPHHFLKFNSNTTLYFNVISENEYEITGSEDDIYQFYNAIDIYDVHKEEDQIVVQINEDVSFSGSHTKRDFQVTFSTDDGDRVAKFEVK